MDKTEETRTVRDPFLGVDAVISSRLTDRLRGKYACGPTLPNGEPEFGWRENWTPPIQHEAAARIETLEADLSTLTRERDQLKEELERVYKVDDQKTREINILTSENRKVYGERDQAREALKPFAAIADTYTVSTAEGGILTLSNGLRMCGIEAAAFERARSVLHQEEGPIDAALSAAPAPEAADGERS